MHQYCSGLFRLWVPERSAPRLAVAAGTVLRFAASHGQRGLPGASAGRVDIEVFPAHQLVLATESKFLATLFAGQFKEALAPIVDICEMDLRVFKLTLDYMYVSSCSVPDVSTLQQLLSVVLVLQINALFAAAATALDQSLTKDNCASMLACADQHHVSQLMLRAEAMARDTCQHRLESSLSSIKHGGAPPERPSQRRV